jgi:uncharacterized membrane protein
MADRPDQPSQDVLVAISFPDQFRATEFMTAAARLVAQNKLKAKDAVFISRGDDGKAHVRETRDLQTGRTAASTGLWSAFIGLLFGGPVGMVVAGGIGAGAGAIAAKVVDLGIPDEWVDWLKEATEPGRTVLAILVADFDRDALVTELERFHGAKLLYGNLPVDVMTRIHNALADMPTAASPESGGAPLPPPA